MGIIPRANEQVNMSPQNPVPIRGSAVSGLNESAIAGVGGAIEKLGLGIMQHYQKQQDMAQNNLYQIAASGINDAHVTSLKEAELQAAPDGSDLQQKFQENLQPRLDAIKENGPTDSKWAGELDTHSRVAAGHSEAQIIVARGAMLEKYNQDGATKVAYTMADTVRGSPTPAMLESQTQAYGSYADGLVGNGTIHPAAAQKLKNQFSEFAAISYVKGKAEKGDYAGALNDLLANQTDPAAVTKLDPAVANKLGLLDNKQAQALMAQGKTFDIPILKDQKGQALSPAVTAAMNAINPVNKAALIEKYMGKAEIAGVLKISDLNANLAGLEAMARNGQITDEIIGKFKSQVNESSQMTPFSRIRMHDAANVARATSDTINSLKSQPRSQWDKTMDDFSNKVEAGNVAATKFDPRLKNAGADLAVAGNRLQAEAVLQTYRKQLEKAQDYDPMPAALQAEPTLELKYAGTKDGNPVASKSYADQVLKTQEHLGIPAAILPNSEAAAIANRLKALPNSEAANRDLTDLQSKWGEHFPKVLDEIIGDDKAMAPYRAAVYAPPDKRANLVDAIKNKSAVDEKLKGQTTVEKNINDSAEKEMRQFSNAVLGSANDSSRLSIVNNIKSAVVIQARKDFVEGKGSESAVVSKAYADVIDSQYSIINSGRSSIIAPKVINTQTILPETVALALDHYSDLQGLKELAPQIPADKFDKYKNNPESFYTDLRARGKWVPSDDQSGMKLMNQEMDGSLSPIFDKYGRQLEKKYLDIMNEAPKVRGTKYYAPGAPSGG